MEFNTADGAATRAVLEHPQKILERSDSPISVHHQTHPNPHILTMVRRAVAIPKAAKNSFVPPSQRKQVFLYVNPASRAPEGRPSNFRSSKTLNQRLQIYGDNLNIHRKFQC